MHELGIVFYVIDAVEKVAAEKAINKIRRVTLEIGEVSGVVPDYLIDCWKWAVKRPGVELLQGSELCFDQMPAVTVCNAFGKTYKTVEYGRTCPYCKSADTVLLTGNEINIKEIAIPDAPAD